MTAIQNNFLHADTGGCSQASPVSKSESLSAGNVCVSTKASNQQSDMSDGRLFDQLVNGQSTQGEEGAGKTYSGNNSDPGENVEPDDQSGCTHFAACDAAMPANLALPTSFVTHSGTVLTSVAPVATNQHAVSLNSAASFTGVPTNGLAQAIAQPLSAMSLTGGALQSFVISLPGMADISVKAALNSQGVQGLQLRSQDSKQQAWLSGQQPALAKGISAILGREISVALDDDSDIKQEVAGLS